MSTRRWEDTLLQLARDFGFKNAHIERNGHLKLYNGKQLLMVASCTPGDPNILHQYRRQLRAIKRGLTQ